MGKRLKLCSGAEAVRKLQRIGWMVRLPRWRKAPLRGVRQKGSHVMLTKPGYQWTLSIPQHNELGPGLLRKLIR
jgi:predicted RNA binding protein YcfA (HicA-like mRNA interferase family)